MRAPQNPTPRIVRASSDKSDATIAPEQPRSDRVDPQQRDPRARVLPDEVTPDRAGAGRDDEEDGGHDDRLRLRLRRTGDRRRPDAGDHRDDGVERGEREPVGIGEIVQFHRQRRERREPTEDARHRERPHRRVAVDASCREPDQDATDDVDDQRRPRPPGVAPFGRLRRHGQPPIGLSPRSRRRVQRRRAPCGANGVERSKTCTLCSYQTRTPPTRIRQPVCWGRVRKDRSGVTPDSHHLRPDCGS